MTRLVPALAVFLIAACAAVPPSPGPRAGNPPAGGGKVETASLPVDAWVPSGRNLFLFNFAQGRYLRWRGADSCSLGDSLAAYAAGGGAWLTLATPGTPFAPAAAAAGPSGHFFVLDRLGRRLVLYDTSAQLLSARALPAEVASLPPERLEVHWTRDGLFTFLDLSGGRAWLFSELRAAGTGGAGDWRLVQAIRLPVGLSACVWEPFAASPCCVARSGPPRCFDRYFNPVTPAEGDAGGPPPVRAAEGWELAARPDARGGWALRVAAGRGCGGGGPAFAACREPGAALRPCAPPDSARR